MKERQKVLRQNIDEEKQVNLSYKSCWAVVAHAFNPSAPRRQRQVDLCEFKASLVCRLSSRTARATQGNPVSTLTP